MEPPILEVDSLSVGLRRRERLHPVLHEITFSLERRGALAIIGESGSGKSVLARALVGSIAPPLQCSAGSVRYRGADLASLHLAAVQKLRGRRIGYIGADPSNSFDPTISIGEQLVEKLRAVRPEFDRNSAIERVMSLLEAVRIPSAKSRFHEFPFQYSGGMLQRAMIVDALVADPELVIADNITQPLDVTVAAQIVRLLRELRARFETAIIYIANSLAVACEVADEIAVLSGGRLVERGSARDMMQNPKSAYAKQLVAGMSRIWSEQTKPPHDHSNKEVILSVRGVFKSYAGRDRSRVFGKQLVRAVRGVEFDVYVGENFGLVGESGCGKSTLSRLLSWIEKPDDGSIAFCGRDLGKMARPEVLAMRHQLQLLLQDSHNAMPPHLHVGRIIDESLRIHESLNARVRRERVLDVMGEVGLSPGDYDQLLIGMSAGQKQRVNIARALILSPKLLILDETLSSLDQMEQTRLLSLFERLQAKHGLTYLFISHDLAMVRRVCSRVAVMYLGKIVELADNETIFVRPEHPYTRALLSAVATLEEKPFKTSDCLLEGEPPSPIHLPRGCSFMQRCPLAYEVCHDAEPDLSIVAGSLTACFLAQKGGGLPRANVSVRADA
jgi:peptide/nickel transport system ATP-binding protein